MALTPGFTKPRDILNKLARDERLLQQEVTADRFFNFVVTAYSLCDWVDHDPSVQGAVKSALNSFRAGPELKVCRDIANSLKHFSLNARSQAAAVTYNADSAQGFGVGRWDVGGFDVGEEEIVIELNDGTVHNALDLAARVLQNWNAFFQLHQL